MKRSPALAATALAGLTILVLGTTSAEALDARMVEAANAIKRGRTYAAVRAEMIAAGWLARPTTMGDPTNPGRCLRHRRICASYPEASHCWIEHGRTLCGFDLVDRHGNMLHIQARFDRRGTLRYREHTFFSEGGAG